MVYKNIKKDSNIITWNANGILNKINELEIFTNENELELAVFRNFYYLTESKPINHRRLLIN